MKKRFVILLTLVVAALVGTMTTAGAYNITDRCEECTEWYELEGHVKICVACSHDEQGHRHVIMRKEHTYVMSASEPGYHSAVAECLDHNFNLHWQGLVPNTSEQCDISSGYFRYENGEYTPVCSKCHSSTNVQKPDHSGEEMMDVIGIHTGYVVRRNDYHEREIICDACSDDHSGGNHPIRKRAPHSYADYGHKEETCVCGMGKVTGEVHGENPDDCDVCKKLSCSVTQDCSGSLTSTCHGVKICNVCFKDQDGTLHGETPTAWTYKEAGQHETTYTCACGVTRTTPPENCVIDNEGHEVLICDCGIDAEGKQHNTTSAEECTVCEDIREASKPSEPTTPEEPEEPACSHRILTHKYYTWLNAERHLAEATCPECESIIRGNEPHSYNKNWHNGTVCQYCYTDANEVKHDWVNGVCSACEEGKPAPEPTPVMNGLNPDDGWYYVNGEKSDFTGLVEYNGGLFYVENGQWQKNLNGLKRIDEDFWFLANGQVQEHHGFALYDGEWFYLDGGKLDVTASGLFQYDGEWFLVAAGRLVDEHTGFAQLPSGEWYYVAEGRMLKEFSGEVEYDGKLFQIVNGKIVA